MLQITDADIAGAEDILLPTGCSFNEERREFIKCMESRDVVACPGSGKTTSLLAKLLILVSYMPFPDGRGICVLTHTNVAINEIKRRAGGAAAALFVHPNYFGTIQGFVNRFLAMPYYRIMYGRGVHAIDNGIFHEEIEKHYGADYYVRNYVERHRGSASDILGKYWLKSDDLSVGKYLDADIPKLGRGTPTYQRINRFRQKILSRGVMSYNDAYSLALYYLFHFPCVVEAIRHRFKFVFIDEMQDTDDHQLRIIDKLFDARDALILQRLGDPNQAIYDSEVRQELLWSPTVPALPFSDSLRYGASIAKVLKTVRVDRALTLKPNPAQVSVPPHLLLFDCGDEQKVLPTFGSLIRELRLHELDEPIFKAIGWVGKNNTEEGKVCLPYYHPEYQKVFSNNSRSYGTLLSYTQAMGRLINGDPQNGGALFDTALSGLVHALRLAGSKHPKTNRPFTISTLRNHLRQTNELLLATLRQSFAGWIIAFRQHEMTAGQIRDAISTFMRTYFVDDEPGELTDFLNSDSVDFEPPQDRATNTFVSGAGDIIEIGTVHSVKGETHTATLYLETSFAELDSKRLLPFCLGKYPRAEAGKVRHRMNLKIAHVAFSRPTHLLAFACCSEHVAGHETGFESAGWIVRKI